MYFEKQFGIDRKFWQKPSLYFFLSTMLLVGCGGSSGDDEESTGNLRLYNVSQNSPIIYLTIDQDLTDEDDDAYESTYTGVGFAEIGSIISVNTGDYFYEIAYQDDESKDRDSLALLLEGSMSIDQDIIKFMVLNDDIHSPKVNIYQIPLIDDDTDSEDDLFNLRILNMHPSADVANIYFSKSDETINEAQLIGQFVHEELSDNQKLAQDSYILYIDDAVTDDVVYQSEEITFSYPIQYIMAMRENTATGSSPYLLDKISNSTVVEYIDVESQSHIRAYNAIQIHDLIPDYQGDISFNLAGVHYSASSESFAFGQFSQTLVQENDDYSIDVLIPESNIQLLSKHLITLPDNSDKTIFFYIDETYVDDDNDGDIDENNDGIVDEIAIDIKSLVVDNNHSASIYDHSLTLINLVDSDDFGFVQFYFVSNNEMIDSTPYKPLVSYAQPSYTSLLNNTYKVYVVAVDNSSEIILESFELVLNEESKPLFLIIQDDVTSPTGYRVDIAEQ